jgi:hypothetical protein
MRTRRWLAASAIALGGILSAGCVVGPSQPYYVSEPVMVGPPPPRVEVIGVAPAPGYFWIDGYWGWNGRHHEWRQGHWETRRPGHSWKSHQWHREGRHWREQRGHWERR